MTIALSRLELEGGDPRTHRVLRDAQQLHCEIMRAFPSDAGDEPRRQLGVLYRVEHGGLRPVVLVQSLHEPNWGSAAGLVVRDVQVRSIDPSALGLELGRRLSFRLEANPTRKVARHAVDGARLSQGRRVELTSDDARLDWLARRGERHGFALEVVGGASVEVPDVRLTLLPRRLGRRGRRLVFVQPVRFEGHLRIVEPTAAIAALEHGIGPAKAYGCGLLSLALPRS